MFKDVDKSMLMKLVALHVVVITVSNALVAIPVEIFGVKLTWAAFTFPLVVIATDLTVRLLGKTIARQTIAAAYPLAIMVSQVPLLMHLVLCLTCMYSNTSENLNGSEKIGGWHQQYRQSRPTSSTHTLSSQLHSTTVPTNTWRPTGLRSQDRRLC